MLLKYHLMWPAVGLSLLTRALAGALVVLQLDLPTHLTITLLRKTIKIYCHIVQS